VLAVAGGIRQQSLLYLMPFAIWATWQTSLRRRAASSVLLAAGVLLWAVPTIQAAGGIARYRSLRQVQWQDFVINQTGGMYGNGPMDMVHRLLTNVGLITLYSWFVAPLVPLVAVGYAWLPRRKASTPPVSSTVALGLAAAPALAFFAFV